MEELVEARPVGVVVVTHNSAAHLAAALESIKGADVVVVDNASTDDSAAIAEGHPGVVTIRMPHNLGFGAACNIGIAQFPDRDVFLMNPDVSFREGDLGALQAALDACGAGIVLPTLVYPDGTAQESTRPMPSVLELVERGSRSRRRSAERSVAPPEPGPTRVDWGLGAAMLIRREVMRDLVGLDERFFLYFEDVDFCLRAWKAGHETWITPNVVMDHHYGRASRRKFAIWSQPVRWHWQSFARYVRKHPRQALRPNAHAVFGAR